MNESKLVSRQTTIFPLIALMLASAISVVFALYRLKVTQNGHYKLLPWNLFLAWLPLVFALGVHHLHRQGERRSFRLAALAGLWLLFFPNAPYIFTDLIHLWSWFSGQFWEDLSLILLVALTGFLVGYVSLYLMQTVVVERLGRVAGWIFIAAVAWLSGFGIYLGRFLRWNSWDAIVHPLGLTHSIGHIAAHPFADKTPLIFPLLFATFLFLGYLMLYALTHLQPARAQVQGLKFKV